MIVPFSATTHDVLLLYPSQSLRDQIRFWTSGHPERQVKTSCERSLPAIRHLLRRSDAALIDATQDPSQATDAFLQAVARLGADAVMMYAKTADKHLELFVRLRGALFLLGPLFDQDWEEAFEYLLTTKRNFKRAA